MRTGGPRGFDVTLAVVLVLGLFAFACQNTRRDAPLPAGQPPQPATTGAPVEHFSFASTDPRASLPTPEELRSAVWHRADAVCDCGSRHFSGNVDVGPAVEAWEAYLHHGDPFRGRWVGSWDLKWPMELIFPEEPSAGAVPFRYRWLEDPFSKQWQEYSGTLQRGRGYAAAGDVVLLSVIEKYFDGTSTFRQRILAVGSFSHRRTALLSAVGPDGHPRDVTVDPAGSRPFYVHGPAID